MSVQYERLIYNIIQIEQFLFKYTVSPHQIYIDIKIIQQMDDILYLILLNYIKRQHLIKKSSLKKKKQKQNKQMKSTYKKRKITSKQVQIHIIIQNKKMEKFTIGQSISMKKIINSINDFIFNINTTINRIDFNSNLRHKTFVLGAMCHRIQFLQACLRQCVFYQLGQAIESLDDYDSLAETENIRSLYFYISTQQKWKKQFQFQQAIICLTKIISQYYNEAFTNITVDSKLQSQIFVILIYIIIGIKVATKCYPILHKKYFINNKDKKIVRQTSSRRTFQLQKFKSKQYIDNILKKCSGQSGEIKSNSTINQFRETLKQSLFIAPLPAIKRQKKQIQSFLQSPDKGNNHMRSNVSQPKNIKNIFFSTQISSSLTSQIQKRNLSIAEHNKPFKIQHRSPFYSTHNVIFKNNVVDDHNSLHEMICPKEKQDRSRWDNRQWEDTIRDIKFKILTKEGEKKLTRKEFMENKNKKQEAPIADNQNTVIKKDILIKKQSLKQISTNVTPINSPVHKKTIILPQKTEKQAYVCNASTKRSQIEHERQPRHIMMNLQEKIKNYDDIPMTQNQNYFRKQSKSTNYRQLRTQIKLFNNEIRQRKVKMQYSMFMLPSMKNKYSFCK